jgi:SAM-dependent methyltransferase
MASPAGLKDSIHHDWSSADYVDQWLSSADSRAAERGLHFWIMGELLPYGKDDAFRFADLGAGGGALATAVLEAFPRSTAVCIDGSAAMLDRAEEALRRFEGRVELVEADFSRPNWIAPLGARRVDAVVSYQAIHNLFDGPKIRRVYRGVCDMLEPDGHFITCDNIASNPLLQDRIDAAYRARRNRPGGPGGGVTGTRFAGTLVDHFAWLRRAGFRAAECPWRELQRAMLMARK